MELNNAMQLAWIDAIKRADKAFADRAALLAACKLLVENIEDEDAGLDPDWRQTIVGSARAAIERAEGG